MPNEKRPSDFDENDMTKMFMNIDKLEELPVDSIFDLLTEKEKAKARRKGKRIGEFFNFIHKIKRFFKRGANNMDCKRTRLLPQMRCKNGWKGWLNGNL